MKTCRRVCVRGALITSTSPEDSWKGGKEWQEGKTKRGKVGGGEKDDGGERWRKVWERSMGIRLNGKGKDERE